MKKSKFEKRITWQKAMDFGEVIYEMVVSFPEKEKFNLASQICRASDSIAPSISEGPIGQSNPEQKKLLGYSIGSFTGVVTCLFKSKRRNHVTPHTFHEIYGGAFHLMDIMGVFGKNITS
ncbi:MAG: four helix bundle protein [Bacteroidota bacterium]